MISDAQTPRSVFFFEKQPKEEKNIYHKSIFDEVSQISLILAIKFFARFREFLGTLQVNNASIKKGVWSKVIIVTLRDTVR